MRTLLLMCSLFLACYISFSQQGKIYLKSHEVKFNQDNVFMYEAPAKLKLPDSLLVKCIGLRVRNNSGIVEANAYKTSLSKYEFKINIPDSSYFIYLAVFNLDGEIVDNNNQKAYLLNFNTDNLQKKQRDENTLYKVDLKNYIKYSFKTNYRSDSIIIEYEKVFKRYPHPSIIFQNAYSNYLFEKYRENQVKAKPLILKFIEELKIKNDENSLSNLLSLYYLLNKTDKIEETKNLILAKFPNGYFAKQEFINKYRWWYNIDSLNDSAKINYYLTGLKEYSLRFKDTASDANDVFYEGVINVYLKNRDIESLDKYETLMSNKSYLLSKIYNSAAWSWVGENLDSAGHYLDFAKVISERSIKFQRTISNIDTYALIMYKLGKYQEAFDLQDGIRKENQLEDNGRIERYVVYAEKVKGAEYAKNYLETEVKKGTINTMMYSKLQSLYKKLNIPEDEFRRIKNESVRIAIQKRKEELLKDFGSLKAIDFTVKDINGENIRLYDMKGKIVILDFWATWCGPCVASFPAMQKLVRHYKNTNDVKIFFVDTFERFETDKEKHDKVKEFLNSKDYKDLQVLFDDQSEVSKNYKVNAIPTKLIIDKAGNICYSIVGAELNDEKLISEIGSIVDAINN